MNARTKKPLRPLVRYAQTVASITLLIALSLTTWAASQVYSAKARGLATRGLDVNDVSVLLPVGPHGLHPAISIQELGVLDEEIFEQVLRFEYPKAAANSPDFADLPYVDSRFITDFRRWKLTSFRFEDCSEVIRIKKESHIGLPSTLLLTRDPGCQPRLRLVTQPFNLFGIALPTAIHILVNLDSAELQAAIEDLKILQDLSETQYGTETFGKALGPHPGLISEIASLGKTTLADHVRALLRSATERGFQSAALPPERRFPQTESITLILQTEINHWKFAGGLVREGTWLKSETEFNRQFRKTPGYPAIGVEDLKCDIHSSKSIQTTSAGTLRSQDSWNSCPS